MSSVLISRLFWADALERMVKTAAQTALTLFVVGSQGFQILGVDWKQGLSVVATAAVASLLTSIASAQVGDSNSASLTVEAKL